MKRREFLCNAAALTGLTTRAWGYVIPPKAVMERGEALLSRCTGLNAELEGRVWSSVDSKRHQVVERWNFGNTPAIQLTAGTGQVSRWTPDTIVDPQGLLPPDLVRKCLVALFHKGDLRSLMGSMDIRDDHHRLALMADRPAIVLGAKTAGRSVPEIWFDKEHSQVLRIRLLNGSANLDIRFHDWDTPITQGLFPYGISIRRNRRPIRILKTRFLVSKAG